MYNDSMDTITITKHITHRDVIRRVDVEINADGCAVHIDTDKMMVPWDVFDDLEQLSIIFSDVPLFLFKCIVDILSQARRLHLTC